jgi:hypothetical protein
MGRLLSQKVPSHTVIPEEQAVMPAPVGAQAADTLCPPRIFTHAASWSFNGGWRAVHICPKSARVYRGLAAARHATTRRFRGIARDRYSITTSALARISGGAAMLSARAVRMLIANSNLVDCKTSN